MPEPPSTSRIATLAFAMLLGSLGTSIANIALPALAQGFGAPFAEVQAVVVAYLAALTVTVVIAGRLGDRFGLTRMLAGGLALFAIASLGGALAPDLPLLTAARALQGTGAAFAMTLTLALMRETAGEARLGRAMGLLGTVSALGTALGPTLGGALIPLFGWRGIFWIQVPLAGLALLLVVALLPGVAGDGNAAPVPLRTVLDRRLLPGLVANALVAAVMMTTLVVGPFYLGIGLGLAPPEVGAVMAVGPLISIASGVPSGRLVDGCGAGRVLVLGLGLVTLGTVLLAVLPGALGVTGYILAIAVLTPGYQLFQAANNTSVLTGVAGNRRGTVSGLLTLARNIGLVAGASVMSAVFAAGVGTDALGQATPSAMAEGMRLIFGVAGGAMLAALAVAFALRWTLGKAG